MTSTESISAPAIWPDRHAYAGLSPYHLTSEQIEAFDRQGYLVLRRWIPDDLLQRVQDAAAAWIQDGWSLRADDPRAEDFRFADRPGGRVMFRVSYVHDKGQPASLELLGSPYVLGVAESLCGPNFVPTYESMVFKQEGDGEAIPWHQDAVHPRRFRIFNFDLYLDQSRQGGGALRVIPGSQTEKHDVCEVAERFGWDAPGVIHAEMEPGDVLLHDVMVLHGSERTEANRLRRTIYYEFRAAEEILAEGPWDRDWIDRRRRLLPVALRRHGERFPDAPQFAWNSGPEFAVQPLGDDEQELKVAHGVHMSGSYCSAGNAG